MDLVVVELETGERYSVGEALAWLKFERYLLHGFVEVQARKMEQGFLLFSIDGRPVAEGRAGDWLIIFDEKSFDVMSDLVFKSLTRDFGRRTQVYHEHP